MAYLTFDRPLKNITQMGDRKITDGEMSGNIRIINNRGTSSGSDDVSLITQGTLNYNEARHHIWTQDPVRILDLRTKPNPTTVDGVGADLYLLAEPPKAVATKSKKKDQSISGVDRVELRSSVRMDLWVDSQSGLLGPGHEETPTAKAPAKPAAANAVAGNQNSDSQVIIQTPGPFTYDFKSDKAIFEASKIAGPLPNLVTVDRLEEKTKVGGQPDEKTKMSDQLKCDLLEIQFTRRTGPAAANTASATDKLEIESVRATGRQVVLTSDAEMLEAYGNEFTYNSKTLVSVLKGRPFMNAIKEGNRICASELEMTNVKGKQQAKAVGEGTMSFLGNAGSKKLQEARWRDRLEYKKEGDKDQLVLYGKAVFLDPEHEQELKGDILKVFLATPDKGKNEAADSSKKSPTPTSVEATGNVTAHSPDMNLESERLLLLFRDVPPGSLPPPAGQQQQAKATGPEKPPEQGARPLAAANAPRAGNATTAAAAEPDKKPRPMDVKARSVQAHVLRDGQRNELQQVNCTGNVHVVQAPEKPGENGVDIRGDVLELNHQADGDTLTVIGNNGNNAQVQMDDLFILGPEINLDQTKNEVEVKGMGLMRMLSKQTFDGKELPKKTELRIEWEKRMFFDGTQASYFSNVGATQDTGRLNCDQMEVTLDHYVSLKQGGKGEQPAVEKMVCYNRVVVEDIKRDGKKVVEMKRINANSLDMDNDKKTKERSINASGPGWVRTYQLADKQEAFDSPNKAPESRPPASKTNAKGQQQGGEKEFKLTLISYEGRMWANNNLGIARFYDHVELIQIPTENYELEIGPGRLPHGSIDMKCDRMEVREEKHQDGTTSQELRAFDRVHVLGDNFSATCDVLKYDTSKEQLILEATIPGTYAKLYRQKFPGAQPDVTEARKILYNRATGNFQATESRGASIIN